MWLTYMKKSWQSLVYQITAPWLFIQQPVEANKLKNYALLAFCEVNPLVTSKYSLTIDQ